MAGQRLNPFQPTNITQPGMFVGRVSEIKALEQCLHQVKHGNPYSFLLHGERGIGKSSLLYYLKTLATGEIRFPDEDLDFNFLTLDLQVDSRTTFPGLVSKISREFARAVRQRKALSGRMEAILASIDSVTVAGMKFAKSSHDGNQHSLLEDLTDTICESLSKLGEQVDGLLILIDEADKPPVEADLGLAIKLSSERFLKRGCCRVAFGLSGLNPVIQKLKESHESSIRNVALYHLKPLEFVDRKQVVHAGLRRYNQANPKDTVTIDEESLRAIAVMSDGYPHFIQQFAWSAFDENVDDVINIVDTMNGIVNQGGALDQLGDRYFHEWYYENIKSDEYRQVLKAMAANGDEWLTKSRIRDDCGIKDFTLDNALRALTERHIIEPQEGKRGVYRLINRSFATWIRVLDSRESSSPSN